MWCTRYRFPYASGDEPGSTSTGVLRCIMTHCEVSATYMVLTKLNGRSKICGLPSYLGFFCAIFLSGALPHTPPGRRPEPRQGVKPPCNPTDGGLTIAPQTPYWRNNKLRLSLPRSPCLTNAGNQGKTTNQQTLTYSGGYESMSGYRRKNIHTKSLIYPKFGPWEPLGASFNP